MLLDERDVPADALEEGAPRVLSGARGQETGQSIAEKCVDRGALGLTVLEATPHRRAGQGDDGERLFGLQAHALCRRAGAASSVRRISASTGSRVASCGQVMAGVVFTSRIR